MDLINYMLPPNPYLIRAVYEWLVDNAVTPYIAINTERADIGVPAEYIKNNTLTLNISPRSTRHLCIKNDFLTCEVSFGGIPRHLNIPITAITTIFGKENNLGLAFIEAPIEKAEKAETKPSLPAVQLRVVKQEEDHKEPPVNLTAPKRVKKPQLRVISNNKDQA